MALKNRASPSPVGSPQIIGIYGAGSYYSVLRSSLAATSAFRYQWSREV